MKQIPVSQLVPGMVTAKDILTFEDKLIIPEGIVLTENIISRLESYAIYYVFIKEERANDLAQPLRFLQQNENKNYDSKWS